MKFGQWLAVTVLMFGVMPVWGQTSSVRGLSMTFGGPQVESPLPDAPSTMMPAKHESRKRTRELLADDPYRPLSDGEKLDHWVRRTYSPYTFVNAGVSTAYTGATGDFLYCCGANAWGRQYAASVADTEARMFFGNYLFPRLLNQDPRYLPKRKGGFIGRAWYAATRVLVTRNDDGRSSFNASEILAVAFSTAASNAYYPNNQRSWGRNGARIYGTLQSDASGYLLKEFAPDLKRLIKAVAPGKMKMLAGALPDDDAASQY